MTATPMKRSAVRLLIDNKAFLALVLLVVVSAAMSDNFLTGDNLLNVLRQTSINAIIAMGVTFVILTAGIDLSVGAVLALSGAFAASMTASGLAPGSACPAPSPPARRWAWYRGCSWPTGASRPSWSPWSP